MAYRRRTSYRGRRGPRRKYEWVRQAGTLVSSSTANTVYYADLLWLARHPPVRPSQLATSKPAIGEPGVLAAADVANMTPFDTTDRYIRRIRITLAIVTPMDPAAYTPLYYNLGLTCDGVMNNQHGEDAQTGQVLDPSSSFYANHTSWVWYDGCAALTDLFTVVEPTSSSAAVHGAYRIDTKCVRKLDTRGDSLLLTFKAPLATTKVIYGSSVLIST